MKELINIFLIITIIVLVPVKANGSFNNLNSLRLYDYLKNTDKKPLKICNVHYCDYLKSDNLKRAVDIYIKDYIVFINSEVDQDTAISIALKGFEITDIIYKN